MFRIKASGVRVPSAVRKAESDFFWKALEVAIGVSVGLPLQSLIGWTAQNREWRLLLVLLPLAALNAWLGFVNLKAAIPLFDRWQAAVREYR